MLPVLISIGLIFYLFDGHNIVKEMAATRYRQFRGLNRLVSTQYRGILMIIWVSLCMIAKMYWMNFLHWANNTIEHKDYRTVIVSYVLNGKLYSMVTQPKRGPSDVLLITDEDHNDLSDQVLPFLGPEHDWHGKKFTPSFWDKKSLTFELAIGETKTFTIDEVIQI